ncbi:unnamed protein product [Chilo suppressalis]|uniref:SET domain-containing protein n=1 Tax=Chilo suppressalis TaxID=168631 RepID=A0ABN8BCP8_CHISP|nr:unnamed protein product [Chilo suppressalis]
MNDDYSHLDTTLIYITESIPGPPTDSPEYKILVKNFNSQVTLECNCADICDHESCDCNKSPGGGNYIKHPITYKMVLNQCKMTCTDTTSIIECNSMCSCQDKCGNRVVQNGPVAGLYVKSCESMEKGLGLFTKDHIPAGSFICEYAGEIITKDQAALRQGYNALNGKMNYVFCLNEHCDTNSFQTFVDPSFIGNIGRYINHSCDPNCVIIPVRVNTPIPKLAIFALKDIVPQSEITFRYGSDNSKDFVFLTKVGRKKCCCNSPKCSGWMPYEVY